MAPRKISSLLLLLLPATVAVLVNISNVVPRTDNTGSIIDGHDGSLFLKDGVYHWYAASYGSCQEPAGNSGCADIAPGACGFQFNHNVTLWTSTDLKDWTKAGIVFQMQDAGVGPQNILFCPKVVFNARTGMFVLWLNYIESTSWSASYYLVATSPNATGPFVTVTPQVTTLAYNDTGDFNLFVDPTSGDGYIIYTSHISGYPTTHQMSVEQLTNDYTATLGAAASSGFFGSSNVEAPALFYRRGVYYAVFGACCCYCGSGSPVVVHTASTPLGPYATQNSIGAPLTERASCTPRQAQIMQRGRAAHVLSVSAETGAASPPLSEKAASCGGGVRGERVLQAAIPAQQTHIAAFDSAGSSGAFMWIGDRWQSAPDGIKGHDFTYWSPLQFLPDGNITVMTWMDSFVVDVEPSGVSVLSGM